MTAAGPRRPLSAEEIARVPDAPGAYLLYRSYRVVYIGFAADGLRAALREHWRSDSVAADASVSFRYLCCENAATLYHRVLQAYRREHGERLPELNERAG